MEMYQLSAVDSNKMNRRMPFNYRLFLNPTINISDKFSLPFSFSLSQRQSTAIIPRPPDQKPIDYIKDPINNVGIHPKFSWGEFHLGTHIPSYSELSIGNIPIFGMGMDINPGKLRLALSSGYSSWGVKADSLNNVEGIYKRKIVSGKIGFGKRNNSGIYINVVKTHDIPSVNLGANGNPEEGAILSSDFTLKLSSAIKWTGEIATSMYTPNSLADEIVDSTNVILRNAKTLLQPKVGSFADVGGKSSIALNYPSFGVSLNFKHLGAGFKTLAYPFQQSDIQDVTLAPRVHLFKNKMLISGEVGYRRNNLSGTQLSQNTNTLLSLNCNLAFNKHFNINGNYNNFGIENAIDNDTLKVNFISKNFGITTTFRFKLSEIKNIINLTYNQSKFEDLNIITGINNTNDSQSYLASYILRKNNLTVTFSASRILNNQVIRSLKINSLSTNVSYKFEKHKIKVAARFGYNTTLFDPSNRNSQYIIRPSVSWQFLKKTSLSLNANFNKFSNSSNTLLNFNESLLTTNLTSNF